MSEDKSAIIESEINDETEATEVAAPGLNFKWYIVRTLTGQENKVAKSLKERIVNLKKSEFFSDIKVPDETVESFASGKKKSIKKKFFPGYVFVKMVMNDDTWHVVKDTDKITGFVGGSPTKPAPLTDAEAQAMFEQAGDGGMKRTRTVVSFSEGETVKVIEGPFASFVGTVEHVNDKGKVKVNVSIFGRPTPVELDFSQIERVS
ncbi:MAG: transcription termination/antitermination protein NusG [Bdellovibrio sp. CG12_big_fil_rev_8_21_14_0_65_39_13]|nr:MAG: transcription termination/antitermination protein NusG [Bdellovibrio sp. CG22_combo_CG10-13_8_21_14_all_39_27]PIQ59221.1 MAG: transcription termination/antitermination protein NusG [Bdellovibrio sp. CG12_big_fil_rev_8_21_14_0_65_39_13]PIR37022.1 MAG: transcription termination/antitermination protein NusG [Bdellovibrio sp. CG11_big_fil_rev_8_21_14_0_20_39_38]